MAVTYCGKEFFNIGPWLRIHIILLSMFLLKLVRYKFVKNLLDFLGKCSSKKLFVNAIILNNLSSEESFLRSFASKQQVTLGCYIYSYYVTCASVPQAL
jgi:hypothetical protein